jgi:hypothetical protein
MQVNAGQCEFGDKSLKRLIADFADLTGQNTPCQRSIENGYAEMRRQIVGRESKSRDAI